MRKYSLSITIIYFLLFILACNEKEEKNSANITVKESIEDIVRLTPSQLSNVDIKSSPITSGEATQTLFAYGKTFYPSESVITVASPYGGIVKSLPVIQGQMVSKGQVIAILEDPRYIDLQQDYLLTKSKLKLTQLDFERQRELNQSKANSDKIYQIAENEYRSNQILLKALSEKLLLLGINPNTLSERNITKNVFIRAKASGIISSILVNVGKYILPSENLLDIIQLHQPYLKLTVYEKDLDRVYAGMPLQAYRADDTSFSYPCIVRNISPNISSDGAAEVICSFSPTKKKIYQNLNMMAKLQLSKTSVPMVAEEAVVSYEGKSYVFTEEKKGVYKMIPILVGTKYSGQIELLNAELIKGKRVVVSGAYTLLMTLKNTGEE